MEDMVLGKERLEMKEELTKDLSAIIPL